MNKEIAKDAPIELTTVKNHVHHILEKARRVSPRGRCRESTQAGTPISQHPRGRDQGVPDPRNPDRLGRRTDHLRFRLSPSSCCLLADQPSSGRPGLPPRCNPSYLWAAE